MSNIEDSGTTETLIGWEPMKPATYHFNGTIDEVRI